MIRRIVLTGLATAALACTTLALAGPAQAADSGDSCTITAIVPHRVVIGITGQQVQFGLKTTCDDQDIKFAVWGAGIATSAHTFWFTACNYDLHPGPTNFNCNDEGTGIINPIGGRYEGYDFIPGNDIAGPNAIHASGFVDANHSNEQDAGDVSLGNLDSTITLLRQTQFDGTFDATPEPVHKGKHLKVSATLSTADWNDGVWAGIDAPVKIQFKAAGQNHYKTVKTVTATAGQVDTTVTATHSGSWRASYAGSDTVAASTSNSDYVKVK